MSWFALHRGAGIAWTTSAQAARSLLCAIEQPNGRTVEPQTERLRGTPITATLVSIMAIPDARIEQRLAEHNQKFEELARGSVEFSDAACAPLRQMETMLEQLSTKFTELRALDDQHRVVDMPSPLAAARELNHLDAPGAQRNVRPIGTTCMSRFQPSTVEADLNDQRSRTARPRSSYRMVAPRLVTTMQI